MSKVKESRFLDLKYETAFENLGAEYYSEVKPAKFPKHILRFRNNDVLKNNLDKDDSLFTDNDFISAFAAFQGRRPFLATKYHGYQFGVYNPNIGDGRGFIYGQLRDNVLYDLGTKGSGPTPYSRGLDGRLTLKGGVRELIASESLHRMGVNTSRCFCLIETCENLTRNDEPSPTRSCVMVRFSKSHIRFGTFERLQYIKRPDLIEKLLDHVISIYYPEISEPTTTEGRIQFYKELCSRVARLVAQWMSEGFCHGVLNTDNMNINGESFDYGPYGFIHAYNPEIVATSFDYSGRYRYHFYYFENDNFVYLLDLFYPNYLTNYIYGKQLEACRQNLMMFGEVLKDFIPKQSSSDILKSFNTKYSWFYQHRILHKLGISNVEVDSEIEIDNNSLYNQVIDTLIRLLHGTQFNESWKESGDNILSDLKYLPEFQVDPSIDDNQKVVYRLLNDWRGCYCEALNSLPSEEFKKVPELLVKHNVLRAPTKFVIDEIWKEIYENDNWESLNHFINSINL